MNGNNPWSCTDSPAKHSPKTAENQCLHHLQYLDQKHTGKNPFLI